MLSAQAKCEGRHGKVLKVLDYYTMHTHSQQLGFVLSVCRNTHLAQNLAVGKYLVAYASQ